MRQWEEVQKLLRQIAAYGGAFDTLKNFSANARVNPGRFLLTADKSRVDFIVRQLVNGIVNRRFGR